MHIDPADASKALSVASSRPKPVKKALQFLEALGEKGRAEFIERNQEKPYPVLTAEESRILDEICGAQTPAGLSKAMITEATIGLLTGNPLAAGLAALVAGTKYVDSGMDGLKRHLHRDRVKKEALRLGVERWME